MTPVFSAGADALDRGVPEIGIEFAADNGFDVGGGYDHVEITQDDSGSVM